MAGQHEPELIRRAKAVDTLAYEDLRRPALAPAARLAAALTGGNTAEAEDAVQEAAVRAWRRIGNLREDALFEPWFLGIVVRQVRTLQAERWWGVVRLPEIIGGRSHPGDQWLEGEDLRRAVARLPRGEREAIVMHFCLDLRLRDVGHALGLSVPAVKSRINRGLKRLRADVSAFEVLA